MRVRFHLGAGRHCGHWQIRDGRRVSYVDPSAASLVMRNCRLANSPGVAKRIHDGADKTPCAWIACDAVESRPAKRSVAGDAVRFNPRVAPHWIVNKQNADGMTFALLTTEGTKVVAPTTRRSKT